MIISRIRFSAFSSVDALGEFRIEKDPVCEACKMMVQKLTI